MSRIEGIFDFEEKSSLPNKIFLLHISIEVRDKRQARSSHFNEKCEINLDTPYLWSNNPILTHMIQQWYDIMWEKATTNIKDALELLQSGVII